MDYGSGWVIFEESADASDGRLVSMLSARKPFRYIAEYLQQSYVDRFGAIEDRLAFKKHPNTSPYEMLRGPHPNPTHVGHDPSLVAIYAYKIQVSAHSLIIHYKILINPNDNPLQARYETRQQSLSIAT